MLVYLGMAIGDIIAFVALVWVFVASLARPFLNTLQWTNQNFLGHL